MNTWKYSLKIPGKILGLPYEGTSEEIPEDFLWEFLQKTYWGMSGCAHRVIPGQFAEGIYAGILL